MQYKQQQTWTFGWNQHKPKCRKLMHYEAASANNLSIVFVVVVVVRMAKLG